MELKGQKASSEIEAATRAMKDSELTANEMRLRVEANQALIDGLNSEKNHLEPSFKENRDQKEQFKAKCDRLQSMYE